MSSRQVTVWRRAFGGLALVGAALLLYGWTLGLGLLGFDTYPLIAAARIEGVGELLTPLSEELMEGRFPSGHFYRPLVHVSFALDHALWGLWPAGYHVTDLVLLVAGAALLGVLVTRLFGAGFEAAGWIAAFVFLVHPVQLEVLPVPARRADSLCLVFLLAANVHALGRGRGVRGGLGAFALGWAALGAKESGIVLAPLVFALCVLRPPAGEERLRAALQRSWPVWAGMATAFLSRFLVLGGIGGHDVSFAAGLGGLIDVALPFLARVVYPQPVLGAGASASIWIAIVAAALAVLAALQARSGGERSSALVTGFVWLALWLTASLTISSLSGLIEEWYALHLVAAYAGILGVLAFEAVRTLRVRAALGGVTLALCAALALSHLRASPLMLSYDDWERGSDLTLDFLERFEHELEAHPDSAFELDGLTPRLARNEGLGPRSVVLLHGYSLSAYADLLSPPRSVEVAVRGTNVRVTPGGRE